MACVAQFEVRCSKAKLGSGGGGGGTGASTASVSGPSTGGLPPMGGETLGFPNWFPFPQQNPWDVFLPSGMQCDFGVCVPIGNGIAGVDDAIEIGLCVAQPEVCGAILIGTYVIVRYGPQIVQTTKDIVDWTSQYSKCLHQFIEDTKACQDAYPPGPARDGCYKAARQKFDLCKAGGTIQ